MNRPRKGQESPREDRPWSSGNLGMVFIILAFLIAIAGGIAFLFVYWSGGHTGGLGGAIALALCGIGAGLVIWVHSLIPYEETSGPRKPLASDESDRKAFFEDFLAGERRISRRQVLGWLSGTVLAVLGVAGISLLRSLGKPPLPELLTSGWAKGKRLVTFEGRHVSAAGALVPGGILVVFPEGSHTDPVASQALLVRVEEKSLQLPEGRSGWTPKGYVAYSRVCTHAGCPVGLYQTEQHLLLCPCHQSTFSVLQGAKPTSGPAARPLPQLPLYVDDEGFLRAGGDFSEPPGPGFWRMP